MAKLTKLAKLDLSDNQFVTIPDSISISPPFPFPFLLVLMFSSPPGKLPITYLKVNRNKIVTLPAWLPQNKSIVELNLNGNKELKLAESVPLLTSVKMLHLKACEITELSSEFCEFFSLLFDSLVLSFWMLTGLFQAT